MKIFFFIFFWKDEQKIVETRLNEEKFLLCMDK